MIAVQSFEEAVEQMVALTHMAARPGGRRVGIVGRGGGVGVITTDLCEREGLVVPELTAETRKRLNKMTPRAAAR